MNINILKTAQIRGMSFTFFSEDLNNEEYLLGKDGTYTTLFGWYETSKSHLNEGFSVTGLPYSVSRAKYATLVKAEDDLVDHLRYHHRINSTESLLIIQGE